MTELWGNVVPSLSQWLPNLRLCRLSVTLLSIPFAPQLFLPFSGLFIIFLPPSGPIPYRPPFFTRRHCFSLSFHPLLPPPILPVRVDISHSDKYVSIYVPIRPMSYNSLQLGYILHSTIAYTLQIYIYIYKKDD